MDFLDQLALVSSPTHQVLAFDALGGIERLCHERVCERDFNGDWGEKGFTSYQKGYDVAVTDWLQLLQRLDRIRSQGITILMLGHVQVRPFRNPLGEDYDRYVSDVHHKTWGVTHKWADAVLFGTFRTIVVAKKGERAKGIGGADRVLYCERRDAYDAKNRYGMPAELDIPGDPSQTWPTIWSAIRKETQDAAA
ncbi:MAG TPA: AAA family ATPase [Planctomycetota bacterium]|nr:AAA family ATPase [Planctomycetota bacterium]